MRRSLALALISAGLMTPLAAAADQLTLTILNASSRAISGLSVYPVDAASGEVIDDNLGSVVDPIAPGGEARLKLSLFACQIVFLRATYADGQNVTGRTDLCDSTTIRLRD